MDPLTLAALNTLAGQVVGMMTPLFSKVGEAFASKFGEDNYEQSKHLYKIVHDRFARQDDKSGATRVLQNFIEDPDEYRLNLEKKLLSLLQADPTFANALSQIIQHGPVQNMDFADDITVEDTHMHNELGKGTQSMKGGNRANYRKVSMNIGPKRKQES